MSALISRMISPIGVAMMVLFFLPWVTVSCGGMQVAQVSASDVATGISVAGQASEGSPAMFLILVGAALMAVSGITLWNSRSAVASVFALLGAVIVGGMWLIFVAGLQLNIQEAASQGVTLGIQDEIGMTGTLIASLLGAVAALVSFARPAEAGGSSRAAVAPVPVGVNE